MKKNCKKCKQEFDISQGDIQFLDRISPIVDLKKYQIPTPLFCPDCRLQRRVSWRNDRNIYNNKCIISWKKLISMFPSDSEIKPIDKGIWWSDKWDWRKYWMDFDFSKTFFEQFNDLLIKTPLPHIMIADDENSLYTNHTYKNKNCYLCFAWNILEDSLYCYNAENSKNCCDCLFVYNCELCYDCIHSINCYNLKYSIHCSNCSDSSFLIDCKNSKNCFFCWNLNSKQYCINNQQYSKEEYEKEIELINSWNYWVYKKYYEKMITKMKEKINPENHNLSIENCTWEYINNSKNCYNVYIAKNCEDSKNITCGFPWLKDSHDCTFSWENASMLYECVGSWGNCYNLIFCFLCVISSNYLYYCNVLINSNNCFWCTSLRNAKYCILNKQYSKKEYEILVEKIINHMKKTWEWWEFFPLELSPFAYNQTVAQEFFPLSKDEILNNNWKWKSEENQKPIVKKIIPAKKLPENIYDIPNEILDWAIQCENSWKPYKITPQELNFYKKHNIPIPHLHPDQRHKARIKLRNSRKLFDRKCMKCEKQIQTTYSSLTDEIVYCKECYLKEVY